MTIVGTLMCYGILRFWTMWCSAFHAMWIIRKHDSRDPNKWQKAPRPMGCPGELCVRCTVGCRLLTPQMLLPDFGNIWHAIIVPNYKEPIEKLRQTLDTIVDQSIAHQIVVRALSSASLYLALPTTHFDAQFSIAVDLAIFLLSVASLSSLWLPCLNCVMRERMRMCNNDVIG